MINNSTPLPFSNVIERVLIKMKHQAAPIHTAKWQSMDISQRPEAQMYELEDVTFLADLPSESLDYYQREIKPNLPWADRHFILERVSGSPINPGTTWKEWPYAHSASNFLESDLKFSHTYAERYWPKRAGREIVDKAGGVTSSANRGIRYSCGDLGDVLKLLAADPMTRQAYLPVWFPEDTGVHHGKRVPCSIGYHFMMRDNRLNVFYPIRSCDFTRHFRDDLYLTVRLLLWMLQNLRMMKDQAIDWRDVRPGWLRFWAGSLHTFVNDWRQL